MIIADVLIVLSCFLMIFIFGFSPKWLNVFEIDSKQQQTLKIPGHTPLPLIGTIWYFIANGYKLEQINKYYKDMFQKFGKIFKEYTFFNTPIIHIVDRKDIETAFKATGRYPLRPPTEVIAYYRKTRPDRYLTLGMVNEQGEKWHNLRSALTAGLISPGTMSKAAHTIEEIADDWCYYIKVNRDETGNIKCIEEAASKLAIEVTCALVLGRRMGFLIADSENKLSQRLANAVQDVFRASRDTQFGLPFWKILPTKAYDTLKKGEEEAYDIALKLIRTADDSTKDSPIFQSVIRADIDEREKIAALVDYISAGIFTLSNSFTFLLHFVATNKDAQSKLFDDVSKSSINYAKACMNESFRLLPTANPLARIIDEDVELGGYNVKKGSIVLCHTALACREEENFFRANEFLPERWLENDQGYKPPASSFLVVPFGVGKRICPGKRFIEMVMPIALASTIRNFEISANNDLEIQFEFLYSPVGPLCMNFKER